MRDDGHEMQLHDYAKRMFRRNVRQAVNYKQTVMRRPYTPAPETYWLAWMHGASYHRACWSYCRSNERHALTKKTSDHYYREAQAQRAEYRYHLEMARRVTASPLDTLAAHERRLADDRQVLEFLVKECTAGMSA